MLSKPKLTDRICPHTDRRRRFVKNEQLALPHDCAREGNDLALTNREITSTTRDSTVKRQTPLVSLSLQREETSRMKSLVQRRVVMLREWVEVLAQSTREELRLA